MPTRRQIHRAVHGLERHLDRFLGDLEEGRLVISPYRGFGRSPFDSAQGRHEMLVRGRVLVEKSVTPATESSR